MNKIILIGFICVVVGIIGYLTSHAFPPTGPIPPEPGTQRINFVEKGWVGNNAIFLFRVDDREYLLSTDSIILHQRGPITQKRRFERRIK